jgi:hypothetical protein
VAADGAGVLEAGAPDEAGAATDGWAAELAGAGVAAELQP